MSEIDNAKNKLRFEIKSMRRNMNKEDKRLLDDSIFSNLLKCSEFVNAETVLVYKSTEIEVCTEKIIAYCLENSIKTALPRCFKGSKMKFYYYDGKAALERSAFGIYEPYADDSLEVRSFDSKTVCIVPALAFDRQGYRLGYGGGFYDRFLAAHEEITPVGICYSGNIFGRLIRNEFDRKAAYVATEKNLEAYNGKKQEEL